ncbi:hypothetical protein ACM66B_004113 [Microbotryomycetes sp. NB124-2]
MSGQQVARRRLDRLYASPLFLDSVERYHRHERFAGVVSTHRPVSFHFRLPGGVDIGPGKFKLGLHILDGLAEYFSQMVDDLHTESTALWPDEPLRAWRHTKSQLIPRIQQVSQRLTSFDRRFDPARYERNRGDSAAMRARLPPSLTSHASVKARLRQVRRADLVPQLERHDGEVVTDTASLFSVATPFFELLYGAKVSDGASRQNIVHCLRRANQRLTAATIAKLEAEYDLEELRKALSKCNQRSSPGPDGLPFQFYEATWAVTGPILLRVLNSLATSDLANRPLTESHIHLLHKSGDETQMGNKRPLSLINTDERLFSQAHNSRLAPCLLDIVRPSQTGFIPTRVIDDNIASMQAAMDVPHSVAPDALVAVLDFQKAYDRVAHDYLEAILEAFGFGPRARQWYASTFSRQCARVYLNGWLSRAFPIQSGVRQGDPLAPSLFALAIEGLAALIREKVNGREGSITYTASFGAARFERKDDSLRFRELLFADDVACGLADFQDADRLEFCIRRYCAASGSRLNVDKSFIYPIGPRYRHAPAHFHWLRVDDTPFRYLGVMVGRNVNDRAQWDEIMRKAVRRMQSIPMHDLPVATKAQIINIYVFSKVVFYDRFVPAPVDVLHTLKQAAFDVIRGHATRLPVGATRLLTPTDLGGFGLHDLPLRLRGARAQWVFKTLSSTPPLAVNARVPPYVAFLRHWWSTIALAARQSPWRRDFRFRDVERACWTFPFVFSRSVGVHGLSLGVEQAITHIFAKLPPRWQSYVDAWHAFCPLRRPRHLQLPPRARGPAVPPFRELVLALGNSADAVVPMAWFQRIGQPADFDPETPLAFTDFARPSPIVHVAHYDIIKPGTWLEHVQAPVAKWIEVWAILKQVRRNFPDEEDTFHRFLLHNWHVGKHVGGSRLDLFPNNVKACALCRRGELHFVQRPGAPGRFEVVETLEHLVVHCPRSRQLWRLVFHCPHPTLRQLIFPDVRLAHPSHAFPIVLFVHHVLQAARKRRWSRLPQADLSEDDLSARVFICIDEPARDWILATNGRFNDDKTKVLPLGKARRTGWNLVSTESE